MSYFEDQNDLAMELGMGAFDGSEEMDQAIYDRFAAGQDSDWEKEERKAKKQANKHWSTEFLEKHGIKFDSLNNGVHLKVQHGGKFADFWPSTGKYVVKESQNETVYDRDRYKRGVHNLAKDLGL